MSSYWINFVKTGNPNGAGLPNWEPYTSDNGATMIFDNQVGLKHHHDQTLVDLVSTLPPVRRR